MFLKRPEMRIKPSSAAITRATRAGQLIEAATRARGGRSARTRLRFDQLAFVLLQRQPGEMRLVDLVRGASLNEPRLPLAGRPCFLSVSNHGNPGLHLRPAKSLRRLAPNRIARSPPNTRRPCRINGAIRFQNNAALLDRAQDQHDLGSVGISLDR